MKKYRCKKCGAVYEAMSSGEFGWELQMHICKCGGRIVEQPQEKDEQFPGKHEVDNGAGGSAGPATKL